MTVHEDRSLLALQGPAAAEALQWPSIQMPDVGLQTSTSDSVLGTSSLTRAPVRVLDALNYLKSKQSMLVQALTKADLSKQYFGSFNTFEAAGIPIWATRTG
eukprot:1160806-Pelagomonas_calceolata.AAC.2